MTWHARVVARGSLAGAVAAIRRSGGTIMSLRRLPEGFRLVWTTVDPAAD